MIVPLITLLKIIALGSIKIIFLLLGIAFFPVFALRFILGGATTMLLPTLDWLEESDQLDADRHQAIVKDLDALTSISFTREEARRLLWKLIIKTMKNLGTSVGNSVRWVQQLVIKLRG